MPKSEIIAGDCRTVLRTLPAGSVHCCVTSPPYFALRSYLPKGHDLKHLEMGSEPTPAEFVRSMVEVFAEVRRVLRDDGVLFVNIGLNPEYAAMSLKRIDADTGPKPKKPKAQRPDSRQMDLFAEPKAGD